MGQAPVQERGEGGDDADDASYEPAPGRWRILAVALLVGFMALLDVTIVNVAIPSIQDSLGATAGGVQWVVSGYALSFGLLLVTGGRLGDALGRRRLMLGGLVAFVVASALAGLAPSVELLVAARLAQGVAAGLLTPQNSGLIQDLFEGEERARAFGLFGAVVSVSAALGPVLGGLLLTLGGSEEGWRWIFWVNVPLGLVALALVARLVPREPPSRETGGIRLDLRGAALLGLAVLAVIFPLVSVEGSGPTWLALLLLAPPAAWGFVRWEQRVSARGGTPLLDVSLLRETPGYGAGILVGSTYFCGFTAMILVLSVHLQSSLGLGPMAAGAVLSGFAVGSAVSSPLASRWTERIGRPLPAGGLVVVVLAVASLAGLLPGTPGSAVAWVLVPGLLVAGLGAGTVISPNITLTLDHVPTRMGGAAGGALQTGQRIGSAVGSALGITSYTVVAGTYDAAAGLRAALVTSTLLLLVALVIAVRSAGRT